MGSILALLTSPATLQIALMLMENFAKANSADAKQQALFLQMAEALRSLGAKSVRSSFESEQRQSSEIDQKWDKEPK